MFPILSIASEEFDSHRRVEAFQEVVANICKLKFIPADSTSFASKTQISVLPELILGQGQHSSSLALRTRQLAADSDDNLMFHLPLQGGYAMQQSGGEAWELKPGLVYLDPNEVAGKVRFHGEQTEAFYLSIPRSLLNAAVPGINALLRRTTPLTPQWRMLFNYARHLQEELPYLSKEQALTCMTHIHDLALMALGSTQEACEIAAGRGVKAARLQAIKADIERHLTHPELNANWIAARHGLSPRYIRALFADADTSFGDYVASRRLALAYRLLCDPTRRRQSIGQLALDAGFGDLSWFNARFKRLYGLTPKEVRAQAFT
ncbi:helix-turn-helix transcriptional regulator [Balneatrix alpica]|uniref:Helix-turn-helix transcriptional regulator n=1 Tax=Balneatrix alpica TaxID=75684 RepID=A0ABV5ZAS3_9GAMM|nr:AraC family transcriptional regulator [Balneatrix alpica]